MKYLSLSHKYYNHSCKNVTIIFYLINDKKYEKSNVTYFLASKLHTSLLMKNGCVHLLDAFHINFTMTKYKDIAKVIYLKKSCQSLFC